MSLCGFRRVSVKQAGAAKVSVDIPIQHLRHWDSTTKQYVVDQGDYELLVGDSSDAIKLTQPLTITR